MSLRCFRRRRERAIACVRFTADEQRLMPTSSFQRQRGLNLWVHNDSFSKQDVVFNLHAFPGVHIGDFVELSQPTSQFARQNGKTRTYVFQVTAETVDEDLIAKQAQLQVCRSTLVYWLISRCPLPTISLPRSCFNPEHL